jgi:glucose/mannose-6-phosphate isomerase
MNLDEFSRFDSLDSSKLLAQIDELPNQLQTAWEQGKQSQLPIWTGIQKVIVCGMGASALGGELLQAYAAARCPVPIVLWHDYDLPAWAAGRETLVMVVGSTGDGEETLSSLEQAVERDCRCLVIGADGELARNAQAAGATTWLYPQEGTPGEPLGWLFGLPAAALFHLGLLPDIGRDLADVVESMHRQQAFLKADVPAIRNPAKRMAGQMMGRWVTIVGSGVLAPVALHWKQQIGLLAKSWAQVEVLPEMDHTMLGSVLQPENMLPDTMIVFLRAASSHPRNRLRSDLTKQAYMLEGLGTDFVDAVGDTALTQQWSCLHYGDYVAYYLAMAYGIDPAPSTAFDHFKREMAARKP